MATDPYTRLDWHVISPGSPTATYKLQKSVMLEKTVARTLAQPALDTWVDQGNIGNEGFWVLIYYYIVIM